jgi:hypothetical protein
MAHRNTTGSRQNPGVTEWGSKARKEQAKYKKQTMNNRAIAEGLEDCETDTGGETKRSCHDELGSGAKAST